MSLTIDDEWSRYLVCQNVTGLGYTSISSHTNKNTVLPSKPILNKTNTVSTHSFDEDNNEDIEPNDSPNILNKSRPIIFKDNDDTTLSTIPICEELYISTKTKVVFLNQAIDIHTIFWKIPVVEYWQPKSGVVKKQMKIVSKTPEEFDEYKQKIKDIPYYIENIIKQIDNQSARRNKFKDERKITVGLSKKDIMNCRGKVKNAFYNCFAIILRFKYEKVFREIHVKVFNTGKLEIPGILNNGLLDIVKIMILELIQPHIESNLEFTDTDNEENVLINSNFNCGYYINREKLHSLLRSDKYRIESAYDPCSYPGVKCKFYFNNEHDFEQGKTQNGQIIVEDRAMKMSELGDNRKYTEISFMIFRTGSCLIVGNCSERILIFVYEFIKKMLADEYPIINVNNEGAIIKTKKIKLRKKTLIMTQSYYDETVIGLIPSSINNI